MIEPVPDQQLPLISIVTPCFNRADFVADAVESVIRQGYANFEHIIIDGGSTDGTLEVLQRYPHLTVVSEPDQGMYDALNKGLRIAQGEVIGWVNSDDVFAPHAFAEVIELFQSNPEIEAVVGGASVFSGPLDHPTTIRTYPWIEENEKWHRLALTNPVTNGWFFRRSVYEKVGYFDPECRYTSDRDFLLRMAFAGTRFLPLRKIVYHYRLHPGSFTLNPTDSRSPERGQVRIKVLAEQVTVLERFLSSKSTPREARPFLQRRHTEQSYRLAATALYHKDWQAAWWAAAHGCRYNAAWPVTFLYMAGARMFKGGAGNSQEGNAG